MAVLHLDLLLNNTKIVVLKQTNYDYYLDYNNVYLHHILQPNLIHLVKKIS